MLHFRKRAELQIGRAIKAIKNAVSPGPLLGIVSLAILFQAGPELQQDIFSIGSTTRASIYAAVYGADAVVFPTFAHWLLNILFFEFAIVATIVYCYSSLARNTLQYVVRFTGASFVTITLFDVFTLYLAGALDKIYESVLGNIFGPLTLAVLFVVLVRLAEFSLRQMGVAATGTRIGAVTVALSLCTSGIVFLMARTLFAPMASDVELAASGQVDMIYVRPSADKEKADPTASRGVIAPTQVDASTFEAGVQKLSLQWASNGKSFRRDVSLRLYAGCMGSKIAELPKVAPVLSLASIPNFHMAFDGDYTELEVAPKGTYRASYDLPDADLVWMHTTKGKVEFSHSWWSNSSITLQSIPNYSVLFTVPLVTGKEGKTTPFQRRSFTLATNNSKSTFDLDVNPKLNPHGRYGCTPLRRDTLVNGVDVEALLDVKDSRLDKFATDVDLGEATFRGDKGWFRYDTLSANDLASVSPTELKTLGISNVTYLSVDGEHPSLLKSNTVSINGKLDIQFANNGEFITKGVADYVWLDGRRINKTLWERVPNDWAVYVTGLLLVTIGFIFRSTRKFMKDKWDGIPSALLNT